ncbi:hypothetical protein ACFFQW_15180 [Umezawaea endophytica]|uniref:Uncharacterized protein n=1 Tax=Umezawaea endophytica TaxID=1654476 RepID=A0A9X3ADB8_9PSEU|nr:hypothetical protein [Umezawaea endophytica]MCS7475486.1 hypothetical protein [Umezawaea endophytica]
MSTVISTITSGSGKVGRYFTVVSTLPSALLVAYTYVLVRVAGAGPVNWSALASVSLHEVALLGLAALVLALATNPLQFVLIQVFEGYWGNSRLGVALATARTAHHRRRLAALRSAEASADAVVRKHGPAALWYWDVPVEAVHAAITRVESQRIRGGYPRIGEVLPTTLGNVLRRYENSVGKPYGLDPLSTIPRLAMVGGEREIAYVRDQRTQLELATRTAFVALCATLVTLVVMGRHGFWLLLAVVPYAVAFFSYRGAVALAHEYGTSLAVLTDLSRFDLYDRLRLTEVRDGDEERARNAKLMRIFAFDSNVSLRYERPPATQDTGSPTSCGSAPEEAQIE